MAFQWSHRTRVTESKMSPSPCWILEFYTDKPVVWELLISLIKDKTSSPSYTTSFLAFVFVVWYHTEYGRHSITPARIAKYCLNWPSVSSDWALLGLQENVFRESSSCSDFLLEVVSLYIFSVLCYTWPRCNIETFLRRVWWSKVHFLKLPGPNWPCYSCNVTYTELFVKGVYTGEEIPFGRVCLLTLL